MTLLDVISLKKTYHTSMRRVEVLTDVSFTVGTGETIGILGPSGSGKSTIGQLVAGLIRADSGTIRYRDEELHYPLHGHLRKEIQILFQHPEVSFNPKYRLEQGFQEVCRHYGLKMSRQELQDYLSDFGLYREHLDRYPSQLSGGELQRAMIARIMLLDPKLIVLDEPTSMLDTISQAQVLRMLEALQRQRQVSYLYITHNRCLAEHLCRRIYYLDGGQLQEEPFPAEICHQSLQKKIRRKEVLS